MKLAILHLSDIHLHGADDQILKRAKEIAKSTFPHVRTSDACLVLITGDIAFSGTKDQYKLANLFLNEILEAIKLEGCHHVDVLMVPGNHDCQLLPENKARTIIIERVANDQSFAEDPQCVDVCVNVQADYFKFRKSITKLAPVKDHPLWTEYEFLIAGKVVRISAINASWMSRLPENPGSLVFPTHQFHEWLSESAELRIAMVHHPLNWYSQSSYHMLRTALRTNCSIILSGHEHVSTGGEISEFGCRRQIFLEAAALQPHDSTEQAGFSVLMIDTESDLASQHQFQLTTSDIKTATVCQVNLGSLLRGSANGLTITKEFDCQLRDPGGGFGHPDKEHLEIDDVFIFPELRIIDREDKHDKDYSTPSEEVLFKDDGPKKVLLIGEEKAGKTGLLFRAFKEFHSRGFIPVYIRADLISSFSSNDISKFLSNATKAQYDDSLEAARTEKIKRICLIDDLDRTKGGAKGWAKLLHEIESQFFKVVITTTQGFEISELVNADAARTLGEYRSYELCRFGNTLRHRLIRKWCQIGSVNTLHELDQEVHKAESVVNSIVNRNLTPPLPFYLLILLQSYSQHQQGELQYSGLARYYEYLMTRNLAKAGIKKDAYDELFNYLSQLAWLFRDSNKDEATRAELDLFTRRYSENYFSVDLGARLKLLEDARLLKIRGNCYQFSYPYVYFFFLGRYLAKNLIDPHIKSKVNAWCDKLYLRKNAHAIIFLSYHSNDDWIIEQVSNVLDKCFAEYTPIELGADIETINSLAESATNLLIAEEPNIDHNQVQVRRQKDMREEKLEEETEYPENGDAAILGKLNLVLKAAEIVGQIVKNYYGSFERARKEALIKKVISGPLRTLMFVFQSIAEDPDAFVAEMEKSFQLHEADLDPIERRKVAREVAYQLLGLASTGAIIQIAGWIGSERLEDDIAKVVSDNPTVAFKLVEAGTHLLLPRELELNKLKKMAEELKDNAFSFKILQSMALRYLHLFHTKTTDRQQLCSMLKIEFVATRGIDLKTNNTKLL